MQVLTAGLKGKLLQGRSAGGEVWRRRTDGVRRRGCRGASPVPGLHRSTRGVHTRESRRSRRPGMLRRRGIASVESLTGGGCSALGKAVALGFGVAAAWMGGGAGDRRRFKGASPGISGGVPVVIPAGIAAGDLGRARGSVSPRRGTSYHAGPAGQREWRGAGLNGASAGNVWAARLSRTSGALACGGMGRARRCWARAQEKEGSGPRQELGRGF